MVYLPDPIAPKNCGECPIWQPSAGLAGCGNCNFIERTTSANEPAAADCLNLLSIIAESDRPVADYLRPQANRTSGRKVKVRFLTLQHNVFDLSTNEGHYLGRMEKLYDATWLISRVGRTPYHDGVRYADRDEAIEALLMAVYRGSGR